MLQKGILVVNQEQNWQAVWILMRRRIAHLCIIFLISDSPRIKEDRMASSIFCALLLFAMVSVIYSQFPFQLYGMRAHPFMFGNARYYGNYGGRFPMFYRSNIDIPDFMNPTDVIDMDYVK